MNGAMILYLLGWVLKMEAALMGLPLVVALVYKESTIGAYAISIGISLVLGILLSLRKPRNTVFYLKDGCVTTALSWIALSVVGALPFYISGEIPAYTDALFETISGFTTTGATILSDVEVLSQSILFWRSFTHWIGGMGVLVFLLAIIPLSGGSHMNLMKAESPGPTVGKLVPKVKATARILYFIYFGMTVVLQILLMLGGMPFLEGLMIAFGTAGTGGLSVRNTSIGGYSPYIQWVVGIFMLLFGVNFNMYYLIILKKFKEAFSMEEVKAYFLMIAAAVALIFFNIYDHTRAAADVLREAFFQVSTLVTSTGYATCDYDLWPSFSKMILIIMMLVGACAGSTGGGLKVSRVLLLIKGAFREMTAYLHPKSVRKVKMDGKTVDEDMMISLGVYLMVFNVIMVLSVLLVSLEGRDLLTNFSAVLATINNMGPGFNDVGPTCNFGGMTVLSKYVLMFDMLAGRLELFPVLLLLSPTLWKEAAVRFVRDRKHAGKV